MADPKRATKNWPDPTRVKIEIEVEIVEIKYAKIATWNE